MIIDQVQNDTYLKATIDGETFYVKDPIYSPAGEMITVTANSKDKSQKIRIAIEYSKGPATYTLGKDKGTMIYTKAKVHWIVSKKRGEGTITLTEEGDYLTGKFSFTGTENDKTEKQITDGEFRVLKK
ncbi:MAG: DUF6252 family protein [Flavobacteriaceae bacterium]